MLRADAENFSAGIQCFRLVRKTVVGNRFGAKLCDSLFDLGSQCFQDRRDRPRPLPLTRRRQYAQLQNLNPVQKNFRLCKLPGEGRILTERITAR